MTLPVRRVLAEAVGTGLLVAAIIGSGVAAQRLSPDQPGVQLLENSVATALALAVLIAVLQPVSAGFNPIVTAVERAHRVITTRQACTLIAAQFAGGAAGAILANLMFELPAVTISAHARGGPGVWLGEVVATAGLVLIIVSSTQTGRTARLGFLVGAWIGAAYWFTSSTGFANPAATLARTLSDSFAGISPGSVPMFVCAQVAGGLTGLLLATALHPARRPATPVLDQNGKP